MITTLATPNAASPGADPAPEAQGAPSPGWSHGLEAPPLRRRARLLGSGAMAMVILILAGASGLRVWMADEPAVAATLVAPPTAGGATLFRTRLEPRRHRAIVMPVGQVARRDRAHARQLWLMRAHGPPTALGLVDTNRTSTLPLDPALLDAGNPATHLFLSLEAPGGSQAGYPKGPTVAEAALPAP